MGEVDAAAGEVDVDVDVAVVEEITAMVVATAMQTATEAIPGMETGIEATGQHQPNPSSRPLVSTTFHLYSHTKKSNE